jgi:hypothetical protein
VFSNFISTHSMVAVPLCTMMACLAILASRWIDRETDPLRAELRSPGSESAEDFYY